MNPCVHRYILLSYRRATLNADLPQFQDKPTVFSIGKEMEKQMLAVLGNNSNQVFADNSSLPRTLEQLIYAEAIT